MARTVPSDDEPGDAGAVAVEVEVTAVAVEMPTHEQLIEWFEEWEEKTRASRKLARRDRDYYDGNQWTAAEVKELERRHQPVLTKNRIARKINFILGEEIRKRVDPVARPRTPQHEDGARAMTDALRYVEEQQQFDVVRSALVKNMIVEGYGGAIKEIDDEDGYKHKLTHVEWDRLFYDPCSRSPDFADAKYLGIVRWADIDDAVLDYPDAAEDLQSALTRDVGSADDTTEDTPRKWVDGRRKRVKIVEMYFRMGSDWYRCDFTQPACLRECEPTVYLDEGGRHSVCPLKMMSCYVDAEGMRFGVVRDLISAQDEINKRSSKALHMLSVYGVIREEDTIVDPQHFLEELAKPDSDAVVAVGALAGPDGPRMIIRDGGQLAQGQFQLLQEAKQDIDTIGPSSSTLPDIPQSASGRAFLARQQSASQELGAIFDHIRAWTRSIFELDYLCIRQFWTEEMWLRVTDDEEMTGYRFVAINRTMTRTERLQELLKKEPAPPMPKALDIAAGVYAPIIAQAAQRDAAMMAGGQQLPPEQMQKLVQAIILKHPLMQEEITENQVEHMLMDIVVDEAPETAVLADEQFETWTQLATPLVQGGLDPREAAKMTIKLSSFREKRDVLKMLEKGPDPKQMQLQQQVQQLQMQLQQAQVALTQSQVTLAQAQAQGIGAQAAKNAAEAQAIGVRTQTEAARAAAQAQAITAKTPGEIERNHAAAMKDAAAAGEKMSGGMMAGGMPGGAPGGAMPGMLPQNQQGGMPPGAM